MDFLGLNMDMHPPKMSPKMAFKTNLHKLAFDSHKSTSQIGGGGGDPRMDEWMVNNISNTSNVASSAHARQNNALSL